MIIKHAQFFIIIAACILVTGCISTYQPPDASQTVNIEVKNLQSPEIYLSSTDKFYTLKQDNNGITRIPYGECVTITNNYINTYIVGRIMTTQTCKPIVSFYSQNGLLYYATFSLSNINNTCDLSIQQSSLNNLQDLRPVTIYKGFTCLPDTQPFSFKLPTKALKYNDNGLTAAY